MKTLSLKNYLAIAAFGLSSFAINANAETDPATVKVLNRAEFDTLLKNPEDLIVIDLRRPDELTNIGGFPVYLSIQSSDLAKQLAWIPKDRKVVTVSNHASRAKRGAAVLIDADFEVVGAVGAQDYETQGGALAKISPPAPKDPAAPAAPAAN
ncbi:MAG: rhodanese-like domain-containing protein [Pseudomonadota bacterium]